MRVFGMKDLSMTIRVPEPFDPKKTEQFFYELEDTFEHISYRRAGIDFISFPERGYEGFPPSNDFTDHCLTAVYCADVLDRLPTDFWNTEKGSPPYVNMQVQLWGLSGHISKGVHRYALRFNSFYEEYSKGHLDSVNWDLLRDSEEQVKRIIRTYIDLERRDII